MYLWKIEYNWENTHDYTRLLWIALNYVSLKDWIQQYNQYISRRLVVNCFKLCIFERLNTTYSFRQRTWTELWIALNYVSLKDWIQQNNVVSIIVRVVNCFKLCIFERLNTTKYIYSNIHDELWIALNYVSLKDWIQLFYYKYNNKKCCELL